MGNRKIKCKNQCHSKLSITTNFMPFLFIQPPHIFALLLPLPLRLLIWSADISYDSRFNDTLRGFSTFSNFAAHTQRERENSTLLYYLRNRVQSSLWYGVDFKWYSSYLSAIYLQCKQTKNFTNEIRNEKWNTWDQR